MIIFFRNATAIDIDRDQFAWVTPLLGNISEECLDASNAYVDELLNLASGSMPDLTSIPSALSMFDANGRLPIEGFLSDTLDMPIDICQNDETCEYTLPDQLRFITLKIPIGYSNNPGSFDQCLGIENVETTYCSVRMSGPQGVGLAGNPIQARNGPIKTDPKSISGYLNFYTSLSRFHEKLQNQPSYVELTDAASIKSYVEEISQFDITTTLSQEQMLLTLMSMYAIIASPMIGMCYPKACTVEDVNANFNFLTANSSEPANVTISYMNVTEWQNFTQSFDLLPVTLMTTQCYSNENIHGAPEKLPWVFIFFYVVFSLIALCVLLGTVIEILYTSVWNMAMPDNFIFKFLVCYSLYSNGQRLLSTKSIGKDHLDCMNGMRFLSMTWVVVGHSFLLPFSAATRNFKDVLDLFTSGNTFAFEAIANALPSVDSFFLMSGTLTTYIFLKELDKAGNNTTRHSVTLAMYYIHRYLRLTIPYVLIMGVVTAVLPFVYHGPGWEMLWMESDACRTYWWRHLLYIQTLFEDNLEDGCMGVTWYLVDDMMFHIFSPIIIYPMYFLYKNTKKHVWGICFWFFALFWFTFGVFYVAYTEKLSPSVMIQLESYTSEYTYYVDFYNAPWARYQAYLIGIGLGYLLHHLRGQKVVLRRDVNIFGWEVAFLAGFAVVYGLYDVRKTHQTTLFAATMYNTFQRIAWNGALAWVIFSCAKGYGGIINEFLSWSVFAPLSRLTFCTYLIHMNIIFMFASSVLGSFPNDFNMFSSVWYYLALQFISCVVAFGFALLFEIPATRAEKLIVEMILGSLMGKSKPEHIQNGNINPRDANKAKTEITADAAMEVGRENGGFESEAARAKWIEANTPSDEHASNDSVTSSSADASNTSSQPPAYEQLASNPNHIEKV